MSLSSVEVAAGCGFKCLRFSQGDWSKTLLSKAETQKIISTVLDEEGHPLTSIFDFIQGITALARNLLAVMLSPEAETFVELLDTRAPCPTAAGR